MKWEKEEEILLVDLYYQISDLSMEERKFRIKNLSFLLRKRAIILEVNIDDAFRNITGINMKLQNIAFIDTEGKFGLSSYSKIDVETVELFKTNRFEFDKILIEVRNKYMNNKYNFSKWLKNVEKSNTNIIKTLCEIDSYVIETKKNVNSLWEINEIKKGNQFLNVLNSDKYFMIINKIKDNKYILAYNCYLKFLKWYDIEHVVMCVKKVGNTSIRAKTHENVKNNEDLSAVECVNASKKIMKFLEKTPTIAFSITQIKDYLKIITDRESIKHILKNAYWAVETKSGYFKFNIIAESGKSSLDEDQATIRNSESIGYLEYEKVLFEKFPRGFKTGASIEVKRFRMFYEDLIGNELLDDDETIQKIISEIGIEYDDSRIMSPQNAIDEGTLSTIIDYIDNSFDSGKIMIYYKSIYEQFKHELITTNVYNEKILKQVLLHFLREKYYFKRSFITSSPNTDADPAMEIKELLVSNIIPMNYEEIESKISHIPLTKLKFVMAQNPEFINTERNYYTHIDCIYLDELDIKIINGIIDEAINEVGFITREDVIRKLKLNNSHIIEKNSMLTNIGLGNAIAYYCSDNYDSNGTIFSLKGTNLSVGKIFSNYCLNKDKVYLNELESLAKELGFASLPGIYLTEVFANFERINNETFIKKNNLNFNVEALDSILDKFCVGDYIAFSEVNTYSLFPSNEYSWNSFLLESYVKNYSVSYRYLSDSVSINKCVGAIVKKDSSFTGYDQVLISVLASAQQSCLIDNQVALNYLYENGFIAKRRMSNIDTLIANAKIIRKQRGKE